MIGERTPVARHEKGTALSLLEAIRARSVGDQGAAGAQGLDAFDLEAGTGYLRVDYHVRSLILTGQLRIADTADVHDSMRAVMALRR